MFAILLALTGCVRVLDLTPEETGLASDPVCVPGDAEGFRMPSARWALAALHAERTFDRLPGSSLDALDADFILASAWQLSGYSCDTYGAPWVEDAQFMGGRGCLGITESVVWIELCRLYPNRYACEAYPDATEGGQVEAQVMAFTWFALAARSLLGRYDDPDRLVTDPDDPDRMAKLLTVAHFSSPWFPFETCEAGGFDTCLNDDQLRHVEGVLAKRDRLAAAPCWDGALTETDVRDYLAGLAAIQPDDAWLDAENAALSALSTQEFRTDAGAVLDAIDAVPTTHLVCPEQQLRNTYQLPCP